MPLQKLRDFLDSHNVKYVIIKHSPAFTAQEVAASAHIPGKELAKTVVVKLDGTLAMAVLPASYQVDMEHLGQATNATAVELANRLRNRRSVSRRLRRSGRVCVSCPRNVAMHG